MMKQRWGLDGNVLRPTPGDPWGVEQHRLENFDKISQTLYYWKDLAQGIAKWHLPSVEALPSAKFWKCENGHISWAEWNILINFCINIDIDKI